jgi:protein SCO1/2
MTGICAPAALALAACTEQDSPDQRPPLAGADIGGPFELVNSAGETVRWEDFAGQYRVVYFGFTYCPDICPTDMQRIARGMNALTEMDPELADAVQPIFISVDPERDTPEIVGEFTDAFSDDIVGLTGTAEQVRAAASEFRIYYEKGEDTPDGGYLVDHSAITYLFGPDGQPLATLPTEQPGAEGARAFAAEIRKWAS